MRILALALLLVGCGRPIPVYVEDDPELVAATEQAIEDLETYLGPTFDLREVAAPTLRMLTNPRGGIAIRIVPRPRPLAHAERSGTTVRGGYRYSAIRVSPTYKGRSATIAHELCHALGLLHVDDRGNLMYGHSPAQWHLTWDQVEKLQRRADLL